MKPAPQPRRKTAGRSRQAGVLLAIGVGCAALLLQAVPSLAESLQWIRHAPGSSSLWRWLTGHLTHWSWDHLRWDLGAFAILSFMSLRLSPRGYAPCLVLAAILIPLEIRVCGSEFGSYRGLSGIDSALLGLLVAALWSHPPEPSRCNRPRMLATLGGGAFLAKTLFELTTGNTVFVANEQREFVPVISAHLTGFVAGLLAASAATLRDRSEAESAPPRAASPLDLPLAHSERFAMIAGPHPDLPSCPTGSTRSSWASSKASPSSFRSRPPRTC